MREIEEHQAGRPFGEAGPMRCERLSVRLLAAHEHCQPAAVVGVHGEIDLGTAPELREALERVLEHQTGSIVVDLVEVDFMDSTGVHVLLDMLERLKLENRRLAIACREGGQVHRVLALMGLLDALNVYPSRESAATGAEPPLRPEHGASRQSPAAQTLTQSPSSIAPATRNAAKAS